MNVSYPEATSTKAGTVKTYPIEQFNYRVLQGRLFITGTSESYPQIPAGAEVVSINEITVAKMLADFCSVIPSDGYNQSFKFWQLNQGRIPYLFTQFYGLKESLSFKVKINDTTKVVTVNAMPLRTGVPLQISKPVSNFTILPNKSAYLKIRSFQKMPDGIFAGLDSKNQFNSAAVSSASPYLSDFGSLRSSGATSLILDLRNNTGGEYLTAMHLFSYLIDQPSLFSRVPDSILNNKLKTPDQRVKYGSAIPVIPLSLRFKGTLYVLINGGTFSAASLLAANLQGMGRAILIGEETGGGRNYLTAGLITKVVAPNSGLILQFGIVGMETPVLQKTEGRGVMPDIEVSYSINEYLSGIDKELELAKKEIAMQSKK